MDPKKLIVSTIASAFTMWVVAGLWHNLIMPSLYKDTHASHEGIGVLLIAYIVLAFIMSLLYSRWYQKGSPILEGLKFGALIGILWVFPHTLAMAGAHGSSMVYVFKNALWHAVEQGIGGIVVGIVFNMKL